MALLIGLVAVVVGMGSLVWLMTGWMRRRGLKTPGTSDVVVRCDQGHLFTTIWVPAISFKAVRLGTSRYQHCPVGRHWSKVRPVPLNELSDEQRIEAARVHDIHIP